MLDEIDVNFESAVEVIFIYAQVSTSSRLKYGKMRNYKHTNVTEL